RFRQEAVGDAQGPRRAGPAAARPDAGASPFPIIVIKSRRDRKVSARIEAWAPREEAGWSPVAARSAECNSLSILIFRNARAGRAAVRPVPARARGRSGPSGREAPSEGRGGAGQKSSAETASPPVRWMI